MSKTVKSPPTLPQSVIALLVQNLINDGDIDPRGKTREQILAEAANYFRTRVSNLIWIVDHTDDLLSRARAFKKSNDSEVACLFYALWFEHKLNNFVSSLGRKKDLTMKEIESVIRDSSYKAKGSWLLRVFGVRSIDQSHMNTIAKLMEIRNSFVHYKWKPSSEEAKREITALLERIEKTVKYLRYFEIKYLGKAPKRRVERLLKKRA